MTQQTTRKPDRWGLRTMEQDGQTKAEPVIICRSVSEAIELAQQLGQAKLTWNQVGTDVHGTLNGKLWFTIEPGTALVIPAGSMSFLGIFELPVYDEMFISMSDTKPAAQPEAAAKAK